MPASNTAEANGWRLTGRTFDDANPGVVTTDGRGYWRMWLGDADGGPVYRQLEGPGCGAFPEHFLYWNGSLYIEYIHVEPTPVNIERMRSGDLIWLTQTQLLVERDQVKDLLSTTRTVVLMRPRAYEEIGSPGLLCRADGAKVFRPCRASELRGRLGPHRVVAAGPCWTPRPRRAPDEKAASRAS